MDRIGLNPTGRLVQRALNIGRRIEFQSRFPFSYTAHRRNVDLLNLSIFVIFLNDHFSHH